MEPEFDSHTQPDAPNRSRFGTSPHTQPAWLVWALAACLVVAVLVAGYLWIDKMRADDTLIAVNDAAVAKWERAVRSDPADLRSRLALAYAYRQVGRHMDSIAQSDVVLAAEPKNATALYNRGVSRMAIGKRTAGEADLWKVLDFQPGHVQASIALGDYYASRSQYRSLLVAVKPAVDRHPEVAKLQYLTGLGYEYTGHLDWATERYRAALKRDPDMAEARDGLARLNAEP